MLFMKFWVFSDRKSNLNLFSSYTWKSEKYVDFRNSWSKVQWLSFFSHYVALLQWGLRLKAGIPYLYPKKSPYLCHDWPKLTILCGQRITIYFGLGVLNQWPTQGNRIKWWSVVFRTHGCCLWGRKENHNVQAVSNGAIEDWTLPLNKYMIISVNQSIKRAQRKLVFFCLISNNSL